MLNRRSLLVAGLSLPLLPHFARAAGSGYPDNTVTIISPFAPGASADGVARIIANGLAEQFSASFVVENRPGAAGSLGLVTLSQAEPDGLTIGVGATGALVINPHLPDAAMNFDPLEQLAPIAKLVDIPLVLIAGRDAGFGTVEELIAASREQSGGVSFGTTGINSSQHLAVEMLILASEANLVHVPYQGSAPAVTDVIGGQIPLACVDITSALPYLQSGDAVALAVTSEDRVEFAPEVPTLREAGYDVVMTGWLGMLGPRDLPAGLVEEITTAVSQVLAQPAIQDQVRTLGCAPNYLAPAEFAQFLASTSQRVEELLPALAAR